MKPYLTASLSSYPALGRAVALLGVLLCTLAATGCDPDADRNVLGDAFRAEEPYQCFIPTEADQYAFRVIELVNEERSLRGLPALSSNAILTEMAADYACEMVEGDFFDHVSPITGSTVGSRALQGGYYFKKVGENLARTQTTPEQVLSDWMESPSHQANILDGEFIEMGAAVRTGGADGWYWVQEFGLPR